MEWKHLYKKLTKIKMHFDKSYKSLTQNRPIQKNTVKKHAAILVKCFNEARILLNGQREKLNQHHWSIVSKFLISLRAIRILIKQKFDLDISVPTILNTSLKVGTDGKPKSK